jgi:hypothetical protein
MELRPGTRVEVWNDFNQRWTNMFEVADVDSQGCTVRRLSDGHVLPEPFSPEMLRPEGSGG